MPASSSSRPTCNSLSPRTNCLPTVMPCSTTSLTLPDANAGEADCATTAAVSGAATGAAAGVGIAVVDASGATGVLGAVAPPGGGVAAALEAAMSGAAGVAATSGAGVLTA